MIRTRRIAAHEIRLPDGRVIAPGVVEIADGMVRNAYSLEGEQAMTEWWGGIIEVKSDKKAYYNNKPI